MRWERAAASSSSTTALTRVLTLSCRKEPLKQCTSFPGSVQEEWSLGKELLLKWVELKVGRIHREWTQTRVGEGTVAIHYAYSKWVGLKAGGTRSG